MSERFDINSDISFFMPENASQNFNFIDIGADDPRTEEFTLDDSLEDFTPEFNKSGDFTQPFTVSMDLQTVQLANNHLLPPKDPLDCLEGFPELNSFEIDVSHSVVPEEALEQELHSLKHKFKSFLPWVADGDLHKVLRIKKIVRKSMIFAAALFFLVVVSLLPGVFGYSWFHVVSESMEREIPKGSLVITRKVDGSNINEGDTITYKCKDGNTVTHQVIKVIENVGGSDSRGFETKGTENKRSDDFIVLEENVIGVVQKHIAGVGDTISTVRTVIIIATALLAAFVICNLIGIKLPKKKHGLSKVESVVI
ncbi:MAG: signal peptidase I [Oscillospiraceae bacterium]|nr:signal peptidase I [Oscillospiraceae bacterium]